VKLVHLVGFITKKFVRMYGHMDVKFVESRFGRRFFPVQNIVAM